MTDRPLDLTQAAAFLGCSTDTLGRIARRGLIPCRKVGGWKFMMKDLVAYVRNQDKPAVKEPAHSDSSSKTRRTGTVIVGHITDAEFDRLLARKPKKKPKPSQNIVRPDFGKKSG